jgi:hypothetical protein
MSYNNIPSAPSANHVVATGKKSCVSVSVCVNNLFKITVKFLELVIRKGNQWQQYLSNKNGGSREKHITSLYLTVLNLLMLYKLREQL